MRDAALAQSILDLRPAVDKLHCNKCPASKLGGQPKLGDTYNRGGHGMKYTAQSRDDF